MIHRTSIPRIHRAFTLIEMVIVLALLTVFAGVAYELCGTTLLVDAHIDQRLNTIASHDSAIRQLRADVWSATHIHLDSSTLQLTTPTQTITWHTEGDDLHETTDGIDRHWPGCGDVTFTLTPGALIAHANTAPNHQSEEFRLTSEQQLLTAEAQ